MAYPERYRIGVSLTPRKVLGQCHAPESSADGTTELLIAISRDEPVEILATLAHELVHASVGVRVGHKGIFVKGVRALGLDGKATATIAGERFRDLTVPILNRLGAFPHAALNHFGIHSGPKKQGTRLLKAECLTCGEVARVSSKWIRDPGPPHCPRHGEMHTDPIDEGEDDEN